jgi:splicing factor 45
MRRPGVQAATQKAKPKFAFAKASSSDAAAPPGASEKPGIATLAQPAAKMSLADWTGQDGDDFYFEDTRGPRQRGGKKKKKKKKDAEPEVQDWDDLYDPTRPNNYEEYMKSEERIREIREWKERLYAHKMTNRRASSDLSSDEDDRGRRPMNGKVFHCNS